MSCVLSVVVVSYNTRVLTEKCLAAIEKDAPDFSFELVVVDNASSDGSCGWLRGWQRKKKGRILVENEDNLGFAKACNQGIEKSSGEYILLLNSDARVTEGAVEKLVRFARGKDLGAVGPKLVNPDGSVQASAFYLPSLRRAVEEFWWGKKKWFGKYVPEGEAKVEALVMAAFLIPREVIQRVGKLDERYFMYFEDLDYCRRLQNVGLPIYYLPDAKVIHEEGASGRNLVEEGVQWRRLVPSSKIYHGILAHWLIVFVMWAGQKWRKFGSGD